MQNRHILGWDIGGAHVKVAHLNAEGQIQQIILQACPLWKGLAYLDKVLAEILHLLPKQNYLHVLTMTGELADCFSNRQQGVTSIINSLKQQIDQMELWVYAGQLGFLTLAQIQSEHCLSIASANWLASANWAAKLNKTALFVDIGSTTTDILLIDQHKVLAQADTDYGRLVSGELLYTGVVRTAVMAITQRAQFRGQDMGLMAEFFATMADVYRLTGDLAESHDLYDTADGAAKTPQASARRLSRLTGYEYNVDDQALWLDFAQYLKQSQKKMISAACLTQTQRCTEATDLKIIGAGIGRFLIKEIAQEFGFPYLDFTEFFPASLKLMEPDSADCAPAVAVANLALLIDQ